MSPSGTFVPLNRATEEFAARSPLRDLRFGCLSNPPDVPIPTEPPTGNLAAAAAVGSSPSLADLGWREEQWADVPEGMRPARAVSQARGQIVVSTGEGELIANVAGRLRHGARSHELPTVGDWVGIKTREHEGTARINAVLPRKSAVTRKAAGNTTEAQVIAANVDVLIVAMSFGHDFNVRRLERFLATAWESGAQPVIALTKSDLSSPEELEAAMADVQRVAPGVDVLTMSPASGEGVELLRAHMGYAKTIAVIGSSGVGKSTLVNRLAGRALMATGEVRGDGRGRHTTVHRQLLILDDGSILIDTPGLREVALWDADGGASQTFTDIDDLAVNCKFSDCAHNEEPKCAVRQAVKNGELAADRLQAWRTVQEELVELARKQDARAEILERRHFHKLVTDAKKRARP